jgi:hypothetical protein
LARFSFLRRSTANETIDWVTAMRSGSRVAMNCKRDIAMIRWALRASAAIVGAAVVYSLFAPKPVQLAVKRVPTYSMMVGE